MDNSNNWLSSFHVQAKLNEHLIREMGLRPDEAMTAICELNQIVMGMVRTGPAETDVTLMPIKGTEILRKLVTTGEYPAPGTYERITAVYARSADQITMLAQVFGDGGVEGPADPELRAKVRECIAASETRRAAKNARRSAAARGNRRRS